jgi:putative glutamine amidotransferase
VDHTTFHDTQVEEGTILAGIVGADTLQVNSHHHQGVATVAAGATVAARATSDGCVEALEWPANRFALGVQWHPEKPRTAAFFSALVEAASQRRTDA